MITIGGIVARSTRIDGILPSVTHDTSGMSVNGRPNDVPIGAGGTSVLNGASTADTRALEQFFSECRASDAVHEVTERYCFGVHYDSSGVPGRLHQALQ